jgi:hypothetical protein
MRISSKIAYWIVAMVLFPVVSMGAPEQCQTIAEVNFLIKADVSNHIPGADVRAGSYSVIGSRANCNPCPTGKCEILYDDGTNAGWVGYYGPWSRSHGGNGCSRLYGGIRVPRHSASGIIRKAKTKGGKLYLRSGNKCYRWTSNLRRVGNTYNISTGSISKTTRTVSFLILALLR